MPPIEDPSIADLARTYISQGRQMVTRVPQQPKLTLRQAVVTAVNIPDNHCDLTLGGSSTTIPAVIYMPHYTPAVGHTCWTLVSGNDVVVIGQHVAPVGTQWP